MNRGLYLDIEPLASQRRHDCCELLRSCQNPGHGRSFGNRDLRRTVTYYFGEDPGSSGYLPGPPDCRRESLDHRFPEMGGAIENR